MHMSSRFALTLVAGLLLAWPAGTASAQVPSALAEVGGETISASDLERSTAIPVSELQQKIYEIRRAKLDELITERLLKQEATKRGLTVEALIAAEVTAKASPPTSEEVDEFYRKHQARLTGDESKIKDQIRTH